MIAPRQHAHVGAQLTSTDLDRHRFQVCASDVPDADIAYLEALDRGGGRPERRICDAKDTGLVNRPSAPMAIDQAWVTVVMLAQDLFGWSNISTSTSTATSPSQSPSGSGTACSTSLA